MKKLLSLLLGLFLGTQVLHSQETEFKFEPSGLTDFVVTPCEGKSQADLYKKGLDWVAVTYKNPKEVLKAQIENDFIRIEGSSDNLLCIQAMGKTCFLSKYIVEIYFKDGKYKFDVLSMESFSPQQGWNEFPIDVRSGDLYFNSKGELKGIYRYNGEVADYFNSLNSNLLKYIQGTNSDANKGDW